MDVYSTIFQAGPSFANGFSPRHAFPSRVITPKGLSKLLSVHTYLQPGYGTQPCRLKTDKPLQIQIPVCPSTYRYFDATYNLAFLRGFASADCRTAFVDGVLSRNLVPFR